MTAEERVIALFEADGTHRAGEFYVHYPKALELADESARQDLVCLGVEGFAVGVDGTLTPHMDLLADFSKLSDRQASWPARVQATNQSVHDHFAKLKREGRRLEDFVFNFVVISEAEYQSLGRASADENERAR